MYIYSRRDRLCCWVGRWRHISIQFFSYFFGIWSPSIDTFERPYHFRRPSFFIRYYLNSWRAWWTWICLRKYSVPMSISNMEYNESLLDFMTLQMFSTRTQTLNTKALSLVIFRDKKKPNLFIGIVWNSSVLCMHLPWFSGKSWAHT